MTENFKIPPSAWKQKAEDRKKEQKLKELYTRYNQCRDLELDRFWKNSVFVWCFLLLCFTAFGMLVKDYNMPTKNITQPKQDDYYFFLSIISGFGIVISFIWVWMARGLKAWYEVYETAIWTIETYHNEFDYPKKYHINNFWAIRDSNKNKWFMASQPISPSKIVIIIGCLLVIIWCIAFLYSFVNYWCCEFVDYCKFRRFSLCYWYILKEGVFYFFPAIIIIVLLVCRIAISSRELRKTSEEDIFNKIKNDDFIEENCYFEIKNDKVTFLLKNEEQELQIRNHFGIFSNTDKNDIGKKLTFDFKKIKNFYATIENNSENIIRKEFDEKKINTNEVRQISDTILVYLNYDVYYEKTKEIAQVINKNSYKEIKITFKFTRKRINYNNIKEKLQAKGYQDDVVLCESNNIHIKLAKDFYPLHSQIIASIIKEEAIKIENVCIQYKLNK